MPVRARVKKLLDNSVVCCRAPELTTTFGRGRNTGFPVPPAQIRTCALTHPAPASAIDGKT